MPRWHTAREVLLAGSLLAGCGMQPPEHPIFADGRATAPAGDTMFALTHAGLGGLEVHDRRTGTIDTIGVGILASPWHVEFQLGHWWVSDVDQGRPSVAVLTLDGRVERRYDLWRRGAVPHQFAVLPDGRLIVETRDGLLAVTGDSATSFVQFRPTPVSGFLISARGGVVHALPDRHITLYNQFGSIRWRVDWPWDESLIVSDLEVDSNGRLHVLTAVPVRGFFRVYSPTPETGEIVLWSDSSSYASFTINRFGNLWADSSRKRR